MWPLRSSDKDDVRPPPQALPPPASIFVNGGVYCIAITYQRLLVCLTGEGDVWGVVPCVIRWWVGMRV